jgi:hypothetical protein
MTFSAEPGPPRRRHPFGALPNVLVHLGGTLGLAQSLALMTAPLWSGIEIVGVSEGTAAGAQLILALVGALTAWLCWRALMGWRERSRKVLGRLYVAGLVMLPLGTLGPLVWGYTPAGIMLIVAAFVARGRVVDAIREGRVGPN